MQNITKYRGKNKLSNYDFILFYFIIFISNKYKQVHMKRNYKLKLVHSSYLTKAEIWIHLLIKTRSPYTNDSMPIDQNEIIISKFIIFLKYIFFKIYYFYDFIIFIFYNIFKFLFCQNMVYPIFFYLIPQKGHHVILFKYFIILI